MGHVYTPGLKVTSATLLRKRRILPLVGDVLVKVGDIVKSDTVVAETFLPGKVAAENIGNKLGVDAVEVEKYLKYGLNEKIPKGEVFAFRKGFFGLLNTELKMPFSGTIESISKITGQAILRAEPIPVQMLAYVSGKVIEVVENEGVVVETVASMVQGIFGIGGERFGEIICLANSHDETVSPDKLTPEHKGKIIIAGSYVSYEFYNKANNIGVNGIVAGGIDDADLKRILGEDIGVAITGSEEVNTTLVVTEGFGEIPMANRTFDLLKSSAGRAASMNGSTQIRAGVIRPEIVISRDDIKIEEAAEIIGLGIGSNVRVIRVPYFGHLGKVVGLPPELTKLESESMARVLEIEFEDGKRAVVPRANVEMIEAK